MINEECLKNFKSSSNKNSRLSGVKKIVNSLQESKCDTDVEDVFTKIHDLRVYYSPIL